ncbi:hypothetical protein [Halorientalis persicus]|jgi:hypothetical protein|nr:hypothetical protein [Halorientalis persicus]
MSESDTVDWRSMPADPDPDDLGYDPLELDITESSADGGHYVILPHDEEFLRDDAFIVAEEDAVVSLDDRI